MLNVLKTFKDIFTMNVMIVFVLTGLFVLLRDVPILKKRKLHRDSLIGKLIAYFYICGGIAIFIILKIV